MLVQSQPLMQLTPLRVVFCHVLGVRLLLLLLFAGERRLSHAVFVGTACVQRTPRAALRCRLPRSRPFVCILPLCRVGGAVGFANMVLEHFP